MIIDCHCHAGKGDGLTGSWDTAAPLEKYLRRATRSGIQLLEEAVQRAGAVKILFGSDGPWLHPDVELAKVRLLGLPAEEERLILGDNLLRLIARVRPANSAMFMRQEDGKQGSSPALPRPEDPWAGEYAIE